MVLMVLSSCHNCSLRITWRAKLQYMHIIEQMCFVMHALAVWVNSPDSGSLHTELSVLWMNFRTCNLLESVLFSFVTELGLHVLLPAFVLCSANACQIYGCTKMKLIAIFSCVCGFGCMHNDSSFILSFLSHFFLILLICAGTFNMYSFLRASSPVLNDINVSEAKWDGMRWAIYPTTATNGAFSCHFCHDRITAFCSKYCVHISSSFRTVLCQSTSDSLKIHLIVLSLDSTAQPASHVS